MEWYVIQNDTAPKIISTFDNEIEAKEYARYLNEEYYDFFFYVRSELDVQLNGNLF